MGRIVYIRYALALLSLGANIGVLNLYAVASAPGTAERVRDAVKQNLTHRISSINASNVLLFDKSEGSLTMDGTRFPYTQAGLQAAINYAASNRLHLVVPNKTITITSATSVYPPGWVYSIPVAIQIPSNSIIEWQNTELRTVTVDATILYSSGTSDIVFTGNLLLDGAGTGVIDEGNIAPLQFESASDLTLENIEIENGAANCGIFESVQRVRISRYYAHHCGAKHGTMGGNGLYVGGGLTGVTDDFSINQISVKDVHFQDGIFFCGTRCGGTRNTGSARNISLDNVTISDTSDVNLEINGVTGATVANLILHNSSSEGLLVRASTDISVTGVQATGGRAGTYLGDFESTDGPVERVAISNITCNDVAENCVRIHQSTGTTVKYISVAHVISYRSGGVGIDGGASYINMTDVSQFTPKTHGFDINASSYVQIIGGVYLDGPKYEAGVVVEGASTNVLVNGFECNDDRKGAPVMKSCILSTDSSDFVRLIGPIAWNSQFYNGGVSLVGLHNTGYYESAAGIDTWIVPVQTDGVSPTASAGTVAAYSTNHFGAITDLEAATSVTITFASGGFPNAAFCTASTSVPQSMPAYSSNISKRAVTFRFQKLTGTLFYSCGGR